MVLVHNVTLESDTLVLWVVPKCIFTYCNPDILKRLDFLR